MIYRHLHPWEVTPKEALRIQEKLRKQILLEGGPGEIKTLGAADISCPKGSGKAIGGVIIFTFPDLMVIEKRRVVRDINFPYIPGLLTFREGPVLLEAFERLKEEPDLIIFDGQGTAHPRGMGIASHIGLLLDRPTIGCAKSRLFGIYREPRREAGSYSLLKDDGKALGAALRTRRDVKPVFISPGYKIDLERSIEIILRCCRGYRLPEPSREAHLFVERHPIKITHDSRDFRRRRIRLWRKKTDSRD